MKPFLEGKSLEAHIRQRHKLNVYDTLHIIAQVLVGLQHLHDAGIVHRDLKPGNIFVTREDDNPYKITLLDLGIARDVAEEATTLKTDTGISMGTPGYMAPEQYGAAATATPSADLYAVGIVAWEMLTGQRPWIAPSPTMLYHLLVSEPPRLPPDVQLPAELLAWLRRMLAKDPADRPQSARVAAVSLASLVPALPPHVPSGAEILAKVAREFVVQSTPIEETVRNQGDTGRSPPAAMLWTPQGTHVPPIAQSAPPDRFSVPPAAVSAPTVNQRPPEVERVSMPTPQFVPERGHDLSARRPSNTKIAVLGVIGAFAVGGGTFVIASSHRHHATSTAGRDDAAQSPSPAPSAIQATTTNTGSANVTQSAAPSIDAGAPSDVTKVPPPMPSAEASSPVIRSTSHPRPVRSPPPTHTTGSAASSSGSASAPVPAKRFDPNAVEE